MFHQRWVAIAATAILGVGLWAAAPPTQGAEPKSPKPAPPASPAPAPAPPAPAPETVLPVETLTLEQFQRLPDGAVIDVRGTRTTAGELGAKARRNSEAALEGRRALEGQARAKIAADRAKFIQDQAAKLDAANARQRAAFDRQRQAASAQAAVPATIAAEANELLQRFQTASPAEKALIQQRARELYRQLQR